MNNIKISVIVPVYNVEKYLSQCIESILEQTFTEWELLLVDDGSPDNSGKICDEYALKDSRIKVFHKPNGGVSSARNLGIDNAKGEWITFIDSDDYIQSGFLEGLYAPIALGEDVDLVHGGCVNVKNEKIVSINQSYEYYVGDDKNVLFQMLRGLTVSKLFRLENVKHRPDGLLLLFDEEMIIAEDMAFTMDYALYVKRFALVPEIGYCYRIDNLQSATKSKRIIPYEIQLHSFLHLYESIIEYIKVNYISNKIAEIRLKHLCRHFQMVCLSLYKNKLPKNERVWHLKNDFDRNHFSLLLYGDKNSVMYWLFLLLQVKQIKLFDLIISCIYLFKK